MKRAKVSYFTRCWYSFSSFDISDATIEKTIKLADKANIYVGVFKANLWDYRQEQKFDIPFSSGALHHIKHELKGRFSKTTKNTHKSTTSTPCTAWWRNFSCKKLQGKSQSQHWKSGNLLNLYHNWYTGEYSDYLFNCNSGVVLHQHAANRVFAKKK